MSSVGGWSTILVGMQNRLSAREWESAIISFTTELSGLADSVRWSKRMGRERFLVLINIGIVHKQKAAASSDEIEEICKTGSEAGLTKW